MWEFGSPEHLRPRNGLTSEVPGRWHHGTLRHAGQPQSCSSASAPEPQVKPTVRS